jgi:hypothetical protein
LFVYSQGITSTSVPDVAPALLESRRIAMTMHIRQLFALTLTAGVLAAMTGKLALGDKPAEHAGLQIAGPFTSGNLTVFLIRGADRIKGKTFLTLEEALAQKKVVVHETQNVNQLSIENVCKDAEVFVQAGDIVKGGQQDRVLAFDLVIPPGSGKMPLDAFCVEAGRWSARAGESVRDFNCSVDTIVSNNLKVAARAEVSQQKVWKNVSEAQAKLASNVMADVTDGRSASSLQLTLENAKLKEAIASAVKELSAIPDKASDAIGCAAAINGKVIGADTYASAELFKKLWPKLLKAAAVEAMAEKKKDAKFATPTEDAVWKFIADGDRGTACEKIVSRRISQIQRAGANALLFECRDSGNAGAVVRQSYLTKTAPLPEKPAPPADSANPYNNVRPQDKR